MVKSEGELSIGLSSFARLLQRPVVWISDRSLTRICSRQAVGLIAPGRLLGALGPGTVRPRPLRLAKWGYVGCTVYLQL